MPEPRPTRDGIDRTAQQVREHAARSGVQLTHEQARDRVVRAVNKTDRQRGG